MLRGLLAGDLDLALMSEPENNEVDFIPVLEETGQEQGRLSPSGTLPRSLFVISV